MCYQPAWHHPRGLGEPVMAGQDSELKARADAAFRGGDNLLAAALYAEALHAAPTTSSRERAVLLSNRSVACLRGGDLSGATRDAIASVQTDGAYTKGWYRLGTALAEAHWYTLAARAFEAGLARAPGNAELEKGLQQVRWICCRPCVCSRVAAHAPQAQTEQHARNRHKLVLRLVLRLQT